MGVRMMAAGLLLLGLLVVSVCTGQSTGEQKPPSIHIDKGACPFECCTYREWVARTDVTLLDTPSGKRVVGQIKKGESVLALTGEVHSVPQRVVADRDYPDAGVKAGDTIYLLHYVGGAFGRCGTRENSWRLGIFQTRARGRKPLVGEAKNILGCDWLIARCTPKLALCQAARSPSPKLS